MKAIYKGHCITENCDANWDAGQDIHWLGPGEGAVCSGCAKKLGYKDAEEEVVAKSNDAEQIPKQIPHDAAIKERLQLISSCEKYAEVHLHSMAPANTQVNAAKIGMYTKMLLDFVDAQQK